MDVIYLNRSGMEGPASIGSRDGAILFSSETSRHLRATLKLTGGVRPMKDDALAPSVNENHGGAFFHESEAQIMNQTRVLFQLRLTILRHRQRGVEYIVRCGML